MPDNPPPVPAPPPPASGAVETPDVPVGAPTPAEAVREAADEAEVVSAGQAALEALVGTEVVLEGGQLATLVSFPDDDHAEVVVGIGTEHERLELVALGDVERSLSAPPPVADVDDETAAALAQTNMLVAGLAIRAGLASYAGEGREAELLTPPAGWLPDEMAVPALEQGVGYAFAYLALVLDIPRTTLETIALGMIDTATQTTNDTTKGGSDDDNPTDTEYASGTLPTPDDAGDTGGAGADDVHRGGDSANPSE